VGLTLVLAFSPPRGQVTARAGDLKDVGAPLYAGRGVMSSRSDSHREATLFVNLQPGGFGHVRHAL